MALFSGNLRSRVLGMETQLSVVLPHDRLEEGQRPIKVLYLLHGLGENASCWQRYTQVEWFVRHRNIAVIMPEVQRSFYTDMAFGADYFTYITDELPRLCAEMFRISARREDTCIAGLSMGGYGALKCALNRPDLYAACGSFSGSVDIHDVVENFSEGYEREMVAVLGETPQSIPAEQDLFGLAAQVAALPADERPFLYLTCGTEDFLNPMNRRFAAHLKTLPLAYEYEEWAGVHNWTFWNHSIELALVKFFGDSDMG